MTNTDTPKITYTRIENGYEARIHGVRMCTVARTRLYGRDEWVARIGHHNFWQPTREAAARAAVTWLRRKAQIDAAVARQSSPFAARQILEAEGFTEDEATEFLRS